MRIVSWNPHWPTGLAATRVGHYLSVLRPDLVLLQEVNLNGLDELKAGSGLDWITVVPATEAPRVR